MSSMSKYFDLKWFLGLLFLCVLYFLADLIKYFVKNEPIVFEEESDADLPMDAELDAVDEDEDSYDGNIEDVHVISAFEDTGRRNEATWTWFDRDSLRTFFRFLLPITIFVGILLTLFYCEFTSDSVQQLDDKFKCFELIDTIEYHNLTPGEEYTLVRDLVRADTGESFLPSGEYYVDKKFVPDASDGTIKLKTYCRERHVQRALEEDVKLNISIRIVTRDGELVDSFEEPIDADALL